MGQQCSKYIPSRKKPRSEDDFRPPQLEGKPAALQDPVTIHHHHHHYSIASGSDSLPEMTSPPPPPQVGDITLDSLLMDPAVLLDQDSAHGIMRLARISRSTINSRHRACQHAHREAAYRLHLSHEQLVSAMKELARIDRAIGRLHALIERAGLSVDLMDLEDQELIREDSETSAS